MLLYPTAMEVPAQLTVIAYDDPLVADLGYGPESAYLEFVWLAVIGPSATWRWRRLARIAIETGATPFGSDAVDLVLSIGLVEGLGRNSAGARTIGRLVAFDFARRAGRQGEVLAIRRAVSRLPEHRAHRMPLSAPPLPRDQPAMTGPEPLSNEVVPCPAGCAHPLSMHSVDLGCRLCDCALGRPRRQDPIPLGTVRVTPGAADALAAAGIDSAALLDRHGHGDWGDIDPDETDDNDRAIEGAALPHSVYRLRSGADVWVITEGDRSETVVITPDEY